MMKKAFAAAVVAGAMIFAGASAANAVEYPAEVTVSTSASSITVNGTATITATFENTEATSATFSVSPTTGAGLSSIVAAAAGSSTTKPIVNDVATATFTGTTAGTYTVTAAADGVSSTVTVTVTAAGAAAGGGNGTLPSTGGEIPAAALWIGGGALGLGALAVVAATARRRAQR